MPPRKRQKITRDRASATGTGLEHVTLNHAVLEVKCAGSRLSQLDTPIARTGIRPYVHWTHEGPAYIEILNDARSSVFHLPLQAVEDNFEDIHLALLVDRDSKKWAKSHGKLWTQFSVTLLHKDGSYFIQFSFTLKWNTTPSPYHAHQASKRPPILSKVLNKFFPGSISTNLEKWSPQDFYQSVYTTDESDISDHISPKDLTCDLYPFQKRAVQWMLRKEGVEWSPGAGLQSLLSEVSGLPNSFVQARDSHDRECYVSHLFGLVTLDLNPFLASEHRLKGGILAEEMGLGKTVEVLSLITLHKRPEEQSAWVFDEFTGENAKPTAATLIIAPPSILQQWISEVYRHTPHLKIMHYEGIKAHGHIDQSELLDSLTKSDIVITTYSVLAGEIHFTQLNPEKKLRNESKYPRPKSPLMQLSWWRVIMDEAQMVGVGNAALVARLIPRINAWVSNCVAPVLNVFLGIFVPSRRFPF